MARVKKNYPAIAEQYIADVVSGKELVCRPVRLTVERHLRDLKRSQEDPNYPFYYEPTGGASRVCRLFEMVRPSKWPVCMVMAPWMVTCTLILFGWKRKADKLRRFRQAFLMWPRKMGKSAYLSVLLLNALKLDQERGAECYSAALTEEQARRVFDEAVAMRDGTPELRKEIVKVGDQPCRKMRVPETNSEARPLSRDKETMEGLNISFAAADEVHKWKNRGAWDVIRYGMRSRLQPLLIGITTAPSAEDNSSICNTLYNRSISVLEEIYEDDAFFCWITQLDEEVKDDEGNIIQEGDRWDDETKWIKACPNLGVTVKLEDMRQEALEAAHDAESLNAFKRYSLNLRIDALDQAIPTKKWDLCRYGNVKPTDLTAIKEQREMLLQKMLGRICFMALDLAIIDDTSALVLLFPPMTKEEKWLFIPFFWIPDDNIAPRCEKDRVPYATWKDFGYLITTPGETTDFNWISGKILELSKKYDTRELIYDPALASGLIKVLLTSGFKKDKVVKFAQNMLNYSAPCGDFVRTISRRELEHDGNPVLRWQITNLRWIKNHTGLFMPDKEKSVEKIDGAVASIMAFGRATHPDNAKLLNKPKVTVLKG
jgi:phage terminase large subunit-like protein